MPRRGTIIGVSSAEPRQISFRHSYQGMPGDSQCRCKKSPSMRLSLQFFFSSLPGLTAPAAGQSYCLATI